MNALRSIPFVAVLLAASTGCITAIAPRNLGTEPLDLAPIAMAPRACSLYVERPVDARPHHERKGGKNAHLRLLLPLVPLWWEQMSESVTYHDPKSLRGDGVLIDLEQGIRATVRSAGICGLAATREGADLVLETRVEHLYAVSYEQLSFSLSIGGGGESRATVFPAGQIAVQLTVTDGTSGKRLARRHVTESAIFDPESSGGSRGDVNAFTAPNHESNRSIVVVDATRRFYLRLPSILDREIAAAGYGETGVHLPEQFMITRQLTDYGWVERAVVETETGRVRSSAIVRRRAPVMGRPGEWVLSPHQPSYFAPREYRRLVDLLSSRYVLGFETNLSAARFYGLREGADSKARPHRVSRRAARGGRPG